MSEAIERARVVAIAREWIGTPYVAGARIKQVGADCTFLARVYEEAGIMPAMEIAPYSPEAHLHRTGGRYIATVRAHAVETSDPKPGDIVMYHIGRDFSHGGIVVEWPHIIHGDIEARAVVLALGDQGRIAQADKRIFTPWGPAP